MRGRADAKGVEITFWLETAHARIVASPWRAFFILAMVRLRLWRRWPRGFSSMDQFAGERISAVAVTVRK